MLFVYKDWLITGVHFQRPPGPGAGMPPSIPPPNFSVPPPGFMPPPVQPQQQTPDPGLQELWVETKTAEGKVRVMSWKCNIHSEMCFCLRT